MRAARWTASPATSSRVALDFAGVQAGADVEPEAAGVGDHLLCAAHALARPGEEGEHAVAGRLDRLPAVGRDGRVGVWRWRSSTLAQARSPVCAARRVESTRSVNRTVARMRLVGGAGAVPVTNSSMMSAMQLDVEREGRRLRRRGSPAGGRRG